jgi:hypothetical protein
MRQKLGDRLKQTATVAARENEAARKQAQREREERLREAGERIATIWKRGLKKRCEEAAAKGHSSLIIYDNMWGYFTEEEEAATWVISKWARENGMWTTNNQSPSVGSDGSPSQHFSIHWGLE